MRKILHIITQPNSDLPEEIVASQKKGPNNDVTQFDLAAPKPDYKALLDKIFESDSVECW